MGFAQRIDYPAGTTTLGAGYTSGSGVVTLAITAASFLGGVTPTATNPVRFTLSSASNPATCCHYSCTGSSGSTLTGVTVLKGTDQNFLPGDNVFSSIYAEDFADIQNAGYLVAPVANASLANSSVTISGHAVALGGSVSLVAADVGLGSVTNDAQTKAAIVPNTAPAAGQVLVGNAGGTAYAPVAMSGDATLSAAGAITVTKTNGTAFAASAKIDTTNAANISSGTLPNARLSAVPNTALANSSITISGHAVSLGGSVALAAADVGLGSVTNDAQTKAAVVPNTAPTNGQLLIGNGTAYVPATLTAGTGVTITNGAGSITVAATGGGSGTVTSVGLSLPSIFTVTGSPVTTSGTLTATLAQENANVVFAGPSSGAPGGPGFRALVAADLPVFVASGASHAAGAVPDPGSVAGTTKFLREDATWAVPGGSGGTVNSGTAGNVAYYATTGTAVSGESLSSLIDAAIGSTQGDLLYRSATAWSVLAPGTAGQVLQTGGAAANPSWIASSAQLVFTSSGTLNATDWPAWSTTARVQCISGGSGGGAGGMNTAGNAGGGGGGGGGSIADWIYAKSGLTFPITINVGVGGTGGGGQAGGAGLSGGSGTASSFGNYLTAIATSGGVGGNGATAGTGGSPNGNQMYKGGNGAAGGTGSGNGSNAVQPSMGGAGGGGGGGGSNGTTAGNGGSGTNWVPAFQGTTGGSGGTAGGAGNPGTGLGLANSAVGGAGGGGGAGVVSGNGANGGDGSTYGGGGGGGGAGYGAGASGGAGGNGGNGVVIITFL